MPAWHDALGRFGHCLCDAFSTRLFSETITKIVLAFDLPHMDLPTVDLVLQPQLAQLNVADLPQSAPAGYSLGSR